MRLRIGWGFLSAAAVLAVIGLSTASGSAQGRGGQGRGGAAAAPPQRVLTQVVTVKPEMLLAYQDLIKNETIPALKKAGVAYRQTWANTALGGPGFTFVALQPVTNYAQFDQDSPLQRALGADGIARYNAKLRPMLVGTRSFIQTLRQDLSFQTSAAPPAFVQVQILQLAPGKGPDFTTIMTTDYLPNYKKAGVKDFWVYMTNFGDVPAGQIVTVRGLSKFADLDVTPGLLQRAGLSAEAAQQINTRRAAIVTPLSNTVSRFVPDLSFGAPSPPRPPSQ